MAQLFDFQCASCDHVFEAWDTSERSATPHCPTCETPGAQRLISKPRLDYTGMVADGSASSDVYTTGIDRWAKQRKEKLKIEQRNMERHGTPD